MLRGVCHALTASNDKMKQNGPIHVTHESNSTSHGRTTCAEFALRAKAILSPPIVFHTKRPHAIRLQRNDLRPVAQTVPKQNSKILERHDPFVQFVRSVKNKTHRLSPFQIEVQPPPLLVVRRRVADLPRLASAATATAISPFFQPR
jgi:hypothetical protein